MVVGVLIVKHVENLSDVKTIQIIRENPYMQYLLGLSCFTEKPVFVPELFVLVRKRLDEKFFNMLTLMLVAADGSKPKAEDADDDGHEHGGTLWSQKVHCQQIILKPSFKINFSVPMEVLRSYPIRHARSSTFPPPTVPALLAR